MDLKKPEYPAELIVSATAIAGASFVAPTVTGAYFTTSGFQRISKGVFEEKPLSKKQMGSVALGAFEVGIGYFPTIRNIERSIPYAAAESVSKGQQLEILLGKGSLNVKVNNA